MSAPQAYDARSARVALYACAEALHSRVHNDPRNTLYMLSLRSAAVDSVLGQVGVDEFHRALTGLTDAACGFLRAQAEQGDTSQSATVCLPADVNDVYVRIRPGEIVTTTEVAPMVYLDRDRDGDTVGVEALNVPSGSVLINGQPARMRGQGR